MTSSGMKRPPRVTLKQVAEAANVSLATASYSLNNGGSVGQETRDRVISEASRLGYRQSNKITAARTGPSGAIGMMLPDLTNPFFASLAQAVIQTAREENYSVFLMDTQGSKAAEAQCVSALTARGVDGIVWFPINDLPTEQPDLSGVPTVVIDRNIEGFDSVLADYAAGGELAARHLVDNGHRRIGIISGPSDASSAYLRAQGALAYLRKHAEVAWQIEAAFSSDLDTDTVDAVLKGGASAILAGADLIAIGVMKTLAKSGLSVPADVSVIGFDNIAWGEICTPALTTIDMPVNEMAAEAIALLLRRIKTPGDPRRRVVFDVELVNRKSVAGPRDTT